MFAQRDQADRLSELKHSLELVGWFFNFSIPKDLAPGESALLELPLPSGFPYQGARAWSVTLSVSGGFVPMFTEGSRDNRFLGVMVTPELVP